MRQAPKFDVFFHVLINAPVVLPWSRTCHVWERCRPLLPSKGHANVVNQTDRANSGDLEPARAAHHELHLNARWYRLMLTGPSCKTEGE